MSQEIREAVTAAVCKELDQFIGASINESTLKNLVACTEKQLREVTGQPKAWVEVIAFNHDRVELKAHIPVEMIAIDFTMEYERYRLQHQTPEKN